MPVFHTKTIESILEPVAQQVSRLVILHEEAEDGNAMPDLTRSVEVVKQAVDNLIVVGYETVKTSDDVILKNDMPLALQSVEGAAKNLLEAAQLLRADPYSAPARKKLIEGSRGILQGTSDLLLAFDESEVRRIVARCRGVMEYLAIIEVIETVEDLVTFVKNISPGLTSMTKLVDDRQKELTNQSHQEILLRCLEQIRVITPVLISSIKVYINFVGATNQSEQNAKESRDLTSKGMCSQIEEIIRVLQLTGSTDDETDSKETSSMKKAANLMSSKQRQITDWLRDPHSEVGCEGEIELESVLDAALRAAEKCPDQGQREVMKKTVSDIKTMADVLKALRSNGQGESPQALALSKALEAKYKELKEMLADAGDVSLMKKAATLMNSKQQPVLEWLRDSGSEAGSEGETGLMSVLEAARKAAEKCPDQRQSELIRKAVSDMKSMADVLQELRRTGQGDCPQALSISKALEAKYKELKEILAESGEVSIMKKAANFMNRKQQPILDWLRDSQSEVDCEGETEFNSVLEAALKAAEKCADQRKKELIIKTVSDMKSMADVLKELRSNGQGETPQALAISKALATKYKELMGMLDDSHSGQADKNQKSALELTERARQWLSSAGVDKEGEKAMRAVIAEACALAETLPPSRTRDELFNLADETTQYVNQLAALQRENKGNSAQARSLARVLYDKLDEMSMCMTAAVADKVADDFLDVTGPLKALTAAAYAPLEDPMRNKNYQQTAVDFEMHSNRLGDSAMLVAQSPYVNPSRHAADTIEESVRQVNTLAPQVINAGNLVLTNPSNEASVEYFNLVKQQWADNASKMTAMVDAIIDTSAFIHVSENAILDDTNRIENAICVSDQYAITENAANIARRCHRILQVAQQEVENSEDPKFQDAVVSAANQLKSAVPIMIKSAKALSINPTSDQNVLIWRKDNDYLLDCVRRIKNAVTPQQGRPVPQTMMSELTLEESAPPRPPLPQLADQVPPRPPLPEMPLDTDVEMERVFHNAPEQSHPIMVAAQNLHEEVRHWESADNELIQAAKQMALLMAKLSQLVRGEGGSKKDLIDTAKAIAEHSAVVTKLAKGLAAECTDRRMRTSLLQVCERIPTIGTQLKILSTVKATMLGSQESSSQEDDEATEMLVGNAQNLMQSVKETVRAAEAASIRIRVQSGYAIRWVRRRPWYTE